MARVARLHLLLSSIQGANGTVESIPVPSGKALRGAGLELQGKTLLYQIKGYSETKIGMNGIFLKILAGILVRSTALILGIVA